MREKHIERRNADGDIGLDMVVNGPGVWIEGPCVEQTTLHPEDRTGSFSSSRPRGSRRAGTRPFHWHWHYQ